MALNTSVKIVQVSLSANDAATVQALLDHVRTFPGWESDNANVTEDTRRGGYTVRYAAASIHPPE